MVVLESIPIGDDTLQGVARVDVAMREIVASQARRRLNEALDGMTVEDVRAAYEKLNN